MQIVDYICVYCIWLDRQGIFGALKGFDTWPSIHAGPSMAACGARGDSATVRPYNLASYCSYAAVCKLIIIIIAEMAVILRSLRGLIINKFTIYNK